MIQKWKCTGMSKAYLPFQLSIMLKRNGENKSHFIQIVLKHKHLKQSKNFFYEILAVVTILHHLSTIKCMHILPKTKNIIQYCFFPFHIIIRHWYNWCLIHVRFYTFQHTFWKVIFEGLAKSSPFSVVWTAMDRCWLLLDRLFILPVTVGKLSRRLISIFI